MAAPGASRPLRILFVMPYFAPAWAYGGPPRVMYDAARYLVARGRQVTVLTTDALDGAGRVPEREADLDGITVHYLPNASNWLAWRAKLFFPRGLPAALARELAACDVAHLSDFRSYLNAVAWRAAVAAGKPYVLSAFGQLPRGRGAKRGLKVLFDRRDGRPLIRNASALLAQTAHEATWYRRLGGAPGQIRLLPLAVDLREFATLPPPGEFRARHGLRPTDLLFLFVGRFNELKGLALLLDSFAVVAARDPRARLVLVGRDDGFLPEMERIIDRLGLRDRVLLPGPLYGPDRIPAYVDADLFAFSPSFYEETSTAALEALACHTPVVTTRQASVPWMVEYGAGLEAPYDREAFTSALVACLDDDYRREMAGNARRLIEKHFDWDVVARDLERAYTEALAQRERG